MKQHAQVTYIPFSPRSIALLLPGHTHCATPPRRLPDSWPHSAVRNARLDTRLSNGARKARLRSCPSSPRQGFGRAADLLEGDGQWSNAFEGAETSMVSYFNYPLLRMCDVDGRDGARTTRSSLRQQARASDLFCFAWIRRSRSGRLGHYTA